MLKAGDDGNFKLAFVQLRSARQIEKFENVRVFEHICRSQCLRRLAPGLAGGFVGTLVILRPGGDAFSWAILLPIGLVLTNAWFQVLTSTLARTENPLTMHFYTGWVGTLLASLALPFVWTALPGWHWWALLCLMGFMGTVGHFILILAYQRAPASTLTPYLYAQIAFAMLGGWLIFAQVPDQVSLIGIATIAVCGAAGAWLTVRERRVPIEPAES